MREIDRLVLWGANRLRSEGYPLAIQKEIQREFGKTPSLGAIYASLERLELMGFVLGKLGEITQIRGGRAKKYFSITGAGARAFASEIERIQKMVAGFNAIEPNKGG